MELKRILHTFKLFLYDNVNSVYPCKFCTSMQIMFVHANSVKHPCKFNAYCPEKLYSFTAVCRVISYMYALYSIGSMVGWVFVMLDNLFCLLSGLANNQSMMMRIIMNNLYFITTNNMMKQGQGNQCRTL